MEQKLAKPKKETLKEEVEIPSGIEASINGTFVSVKGQKGELKRDFLYPGVKIQKEGNKIIISADSPSKREKAIVNTFVAHLNNMLAGVTKGFKYKMKIVFSHFPITAKVVGKELEITNFFGEKRARRAQIIGNVKVNATKEEVLIEGINVEEVGQTMANIELATKIRYRDQRVFQDGIYLVSREE